MTFTLNNEDFTLLVGDTNAAWRSHQDDTTSEAFERLYALLGDAPDRFRHAQALLRHAVPSGDAAEIIDRALTLLVEDLERRKAAQVTRPRAARDSDGMSRLIPADVRREVWKRDGGRCAFVGAHRKRASALPALRKACARWATAAYDVWLAAI